MTSTFGFTYIDAHFMYCEETLLFVINQIYNMPYLQGIKSFFGVLVLRFRRTYESYCIII